MVFGRHLKAYVPFRTLSRLLWQFVQSGGVTVSDLNSVGFVLQRTASNRQRLCQAFGTAGISGRASAGAQKTFRLRQPFPSLPRCGFLLFVKRRKGQRQLAVACGTQKRCRRRCYHFAFFLFRQGEKENGGRIACTESRYAGERQQNRVQTK